MSEPDPEWEPGGAWFPLILVLGLCALGWVIAFIGHTLEGM